MYKIFADDTLIYDSTLEDYKIGKGQVSLEANKSGSFVFSVYPDHFFYDKFIRLKTVITVYKSEKIVFRGRILNDVTDYWNNKVITCEGELGFLQDSIIRPFSFTGSPVDLFKKFIQEHNSQVDEFKRFKIGEITIKDKNNYVNRSSTDYGNTLTTLQGATTGSALGGHIHITHGEDGTDPIPTINYLADYTNVSTQSIEFGSNLKNYTKTVKAEAIATAIIPLGTNVSSDNSRLTIKDVNGGSDYIYHEAGVALYGWIFKTVVWDDVTLANNLKAKAEEYLESVVNQNITIELNAIDLHLLDHSIESFKVCDYVRVVSAPHNFDAVLLCNKQTLDLLKPENDTVVLGYEISTLTSATTQTAASISSLGKEISSIKQDFSNIELSVTNGETSSSLELKSGNVVLSSADITFNGFVTFTGLKDGTTKINGGCLETNSVIANVQIQSPIISGGTINVNDKFVVDADGNVTMSGSISWGTNSPYKSQFSKTGSTWHDTMKSTDYYRRDSYDGGVTWGAAYQFRGEDGQDGEDGSDADVPNYIHNTYIGATEIRSPTITGNNIIALGTFQVGYGDADDFTGTGFMGYAEGLDADDEVTYGVALANTELLEEGDNYVIVTDAGIRIQAGSSKIYITDNVARIMVGGVDFAVRSTGVTINGAAVQTA